MRQGREVDRDMEPLVSIIMPTYNQANFIGDAIASVLNQSYKNWELLVIDNTSTDGTGRFLATIQDSRLRVLGIENEGVIARSRNLGITNSRGELIAFLDSDDLWEKHKLEIAVKEIENGAGFVFHDMTEIDSAGRVTGSRISRELKSPAWRDLMVRGNVIANSSVLTRRSLLLKIGGMNEAPDLIAVEDFNAWLKIAFLDVRFKHISGELGCYRIHQGSMSLSSTVAGPAFPAFSEFQDRISRSDRRKISANHYYHAGRIAFEAAQFDSASNCFYKALRFSGSLVELKAATFLLFTLFYRALRH